MKALADELLKSFIYVAGIPFAIFAGSQVAPAMETVAAYVALIG